MKIYQLEDIKAGVIFRNTSPKLYDAIKNELRKVELGKGVSEGFIDAMYKAGIIPDGNNFFSPLVFDMGAIIVIIISNKQIEYTDIIRIRSKFIELFSKDAAAGEEIPEDSILKSLLSEEEKSKQRRPVKQVIRAVSGCKCKDNNFCDMEPSEGCQIYHIKNPRDIFRYKPVALAYYYYCHEYYIATKYILDDFLDRAYIDVTKGKEISPKNLTL